jgi:hypothetical protein
VTTKLEGRCWRVVALQYIECTEVGVAAGLWLASVFDSLSEREEREGKKKKSEARGKKGKGAAGSYSLGKVFSVLTESLQSLYRTISHCVLISLPFAVLAFKLQAFRPQVCHFHGYEVFHAPITPTGARSDIPGNYAYMRGHEAGLHPANRSPLPSYCITRFTPTTTVPSAQGPSLLPICRTLTSPPPRLLNSN